MLRPAPMPTTPNVADWERLRARFLCEEMQPTDVNPRGRTPAEAAVDANARTLNAFRSLFPGRAMPFAIARPTQSKSTEMLPGGVTTADGRTWMISARVEDDRSSFAPQDRIDAQELADTAECYDPDLILRAPVICPEDGPGHWTGEYAKQTLGQIDAAAFDGYNLWTLVKQNDGRVSKAIADGLINRSVGLMPKYSEAGGKPYLRHLLITAETPGITNLRPLEEFFPAGANAAASRAVSETPMRWRTFNDLPVAERTTTMAEKTEVNEPETLDIDKLAAALAPALATHLRTAAPKTEPDPTKTRTEPDLDAKVRAIVSAEVAPLKTENEQLRTKLAAFETQRTAEVEAAKVRAKAERDETVRTTLDRAFTENRISAQERSLLEQTYAHAEVPDAVVKAGLADVAKRTAQKSRRMEPIVVNGDKETVIDPDLLAAANGGADLDTVRQAAQIRAKFASEPDEKKRAALISQEWMRIGATQHQDDNA